jgi:hypothetical protein
MDPTYRWQEFRGARQHADNNFHVFSQILKLNPDESSAQNRDSLTDIVKSNFEPTFNAVHHLVSYLTTRQKDFAAIEREARAATQVALDMAENIKAELAKSSEEAKKIVDDTRKAAAEQGVSQQAVYFKEEAEAHQREAKKWSRYTVYTAVGLGTFAVLSLFLHKVPFLTPANSSESIQLAISKAFLAGTLGYMLVLCAKNFLSHKHNEVLNKHRQNALLTFNALVDATKDETKRDIVLQNAASCIFSPQDTGYSKHAASGDGGTVKLVEISPKMTGAGS